MKLLNKLIFTCLLGKTAAVLLSGKRAVWMEFEPEESEARTGRIYVGKVKNIVPNLQAAFVEYQPGINGYYSLRENRTHIFADKKPHTALHEGDEILVQVARAAVKTKDAVLTSNLSFAGTYAVLTAGLPKLGISSKIRNAGWKAAVKEWWETETHDGYGLIVRTNAESAGMEALKREKEKLASQYFDVLSKGMSRTALSLLYSPESFPLRTVKNTHTSEYREILTDLREIYEELLSAGIDARLYEDENLPLSSLYSLNSALSEALSRRVWLKSGGNILIEPTEAMTVIDVNTGKTAGKKSFKETVLKTNLEAAGEIAVQLRLRNLSGIIVIDFIDMEAEEDRQTLLSAFRKLLAQDPVPARLVDMTPLGLVEVTRKKLQKPLHEQVPGRGKAL